MCLYAQLRTCGRHILAVLASDGGSVLNHMRQEASGCVLFTVRGFLKTTHNQCLQDSLQYKSIYKSCLTLKTEFSEM